MAPFTRTVGPPGGETLSAHGCGHVGRSAPPEDRIVVREQRLRAPGRCPWCDGGHAISVSACDFIHARLAQQHRVVDHRVDAKRKLGTCAAARRNSSSTATSTKLRQRGAAKWRKCLWRPHTAAAIDSVTHCAPQRASFLSHRTARPQCGAGDARRADRKDRARRPMPAQPRVSTPCRRHDAAGGRFATGCDDQRAGLQKRCTK